MKNFKRRFLSLIMAVAMVCSFSTVVASAAEVQSTDAMVVSQEDVTVASTYDLRALTDMLEYPDITTGTIKTGNFFQSAPLGSYITIVIRCDSACTVGVNGQSKYIPSGGGKYTICAADLRNSGYTIRFHSNANVAIFQFFATDYSYNG